MHSVAPSRPHPSAWANRRWTHALWPLLALLMGLLALLFHAWGEARSWAQWDLVDIVGEGGMVAMTGLWLHLIASGRPTGRVSNWLVLGLAALTLGFWVDLLDEFNRLPKAMLWDNALESLLMLGGMLAFTRGLVLWREEQRAISARLLKRERLFRDHRAYDAVTQLADASYMAQQIDLERSAHPQREAALLMLALPGHSRRSREEGLAESERALQAVSLLLLLNLPPDSLLCRYAGEHFCVLLPGTRPDQAQALAQQLTQAVAGLHHHRLDGTRQPLLARCAHLQLPGGGPASAPGGAAPAAPDLLRELHRLLALPQSPSDRPASAR